jgi:beta-galactosidase GanA
MVSRHDPSREIPSSIFYPNPSNVNTQIPYLRKTKTSSQLIVYGKPFLMLAGELHNSSFSDAAYMSTVWPKMKATNINTLLGSVAWEAIEPIEGRFNFSQLDVILDARKFDMHLVLIWFGSFKNAFSTYARAWVKQDVKRFPRVHTLEVGGVMKTLELVSPFCKEGWKADAKAFAALMRHLKEFDGNHNTVLMVQVENETGLLGDSRDRPRLASELFKKPASEAVISNLQS